MRNTTGHRLVLECAVAAAKELVRPAMVTFHTDCYYFANGQRQLATWKDNGWKRADGKELRNLDLWQEIEELLRPHAVKFKVESMELYKMKMNATVLGKMGVCGTVGIKKWITTKRHVFTGAN